jgi:hypothetical protein
VLFLVYLIGDLFHHTTVSRWHDRFYTNTRSRVVSARFYSYEFQVLMKGLVIWRRSCDGNKTITFFQRTSIFLGDEYFLLWLKVYEVQRNDLCRVVWLKQLLVFCINEPLSGVRLMFKIFFCIIQSHCFRGSFKCDRI